MARSRGQWSRWWAAVSILGEGKALPDVWGGDAGTSGHWAWRSLCAVSGAVGESGNYLGGAEVRGIFIDGRLSLSSIRCVPVKDGGSFENASTLIT